MRTKRPADEQAEIRALSEDIGRFLKQRRRVHGLTQGELGIRAGVEVSRISRVERGGGCSIFILACICLALEVTPADAIGWDAFEVRRRERRNGAAGLSGPLGLRRVEHRLPEPVPEVVSEVAETRGREPKLAREQERVPGSGVGERKVSAKPPDRAMRELLKHQKGIDAAADARAEQERVARAEREREWRARR